jgi:two-component system, NarL family, sensor kinase
MLQKLFFSFVLLFSISAYGQLSNLDSLEKVINSMPDDTTKINKLNEYSRTIQLTNSDRAISIIKTTIILGQKINYPFGLAVAYDLWAGLLFYDMKLDSCRLMEDNAYALVSTYKEKASKILTADIIIKYAAIYQMQLNYDSAVAHYLKAVNILKGLGDEQKIMKSYYNLSWIYKKLGDTIKTFFYARETNRLAVLSKDTSLLIKGLIVLGEAYNFVENYDSLLFISQKGLILAKNQHLVFNIGIFNKFLGLYYANKTKQYDLAIIHFKIALQSFDSINIPFDKAMILQNIGNAYLKKNDYINSIKFSKLAIELSKSYKFEEVLSLSLIDLVQSEEYMGNIPESYNYLKQFVNVNDSIQNHNNQKKVFALETKYETEKKETQLKLQQSSIKQKNTLNILLGSIAAAILLVSLVSYKNYRNKQKLQQQKISELETQQQLTATEAVLKGEEQERTRLAKDLHDGLGGMLSGIKYSFNTMKGNLIMTPDNAQAFERSMDMLDSSIKEMRRVAHNMMPEALVKFGLDTALKDFCNDINISGALQVKYQSSGITNEQIEQTTTITIYRIVQELLNNSMKHAAAKNAIIQVLKNAKQISVTVEDDGKGFDKAILKQPRGMGWSNIMSRIEFLKGRIDVDSQKGKGTSVYIEINM